MAEEDALEFREFVQLDRIRGELAQKDQIELTFHKRDDTWLTMRILPMSGYSQATPKTLWIFEDDTLTVKLQQEEEAAKAAAAKEYAAKKGILEETEEEASATLSGIADRPYCKGRAYDPNRYNTEE